MLRCQPPFWCIPPALASSWPPAPAPTAETFQCFSGLVFTLQQIAPLSLSVSLQWTVVGSAQSHPRMLVLFWRTMKGEVAKASELFGRKRGVHEHDCFWKFKSLHCPDSSRPGHLCLSVPGWASGGEAGERLQSSGCQDPPTQRWEEPMWTPWSHCICPSDELVLLIYSISPCKSSAERLTSNEKQFLFQDHSQAFILTRIFQFLIGQRHFCRLLTETWQAKCFIWVWLFKNLYIKINRIYNLPSAAEQTDTTITQTATLCQTSDQEFKS